jgi:sugar lactone lactonase YvrE
VYKALLLALIVPYWAAGQTYTIQTFAGGGIPENITGTSASLLPTNSVAVDRAGNLFFAEASHVVLRLDAATSVLTLVAGNGTPGYSGDNGPATSAQLNFPNGIAVDAAGNLYIADAGNNRVRKVSHGVITTVAGDGTAGYSGDNGPATSAQLNYPSGIAVDSGGNLYVADTDNDRIREVSNAVITTVAGGGEAVGDGGPASSAELTYPGGVALDSAGDLFIADTNDNRIRKVSNAVITTVAGNGAYGYSGDNGPATSAQLSSPSGVAVDSAGNLYVSDTDNNRIRKVSNGAITTVAGNGTPGYSGDSGPATSAQLNYPNGVAVDAAGNLYIADTDNDRIRKASNGVIGTAAGGGGVVGDNGPATSAQLNYPNGVAVDAAGDVYIVDSGNERIRKVSNGAIATVAGNGTSGFSGDSGPATSAQLNYPNGVAVDATGDLYIADTDNQVIRKVSNGVITTVAGTALSGGLSGDGGPATSAQLNNPNGVAMDAAGNLYIADAGNNRVRKVSNGVIATVAGNGAPGFGGDNGPATSAQLSDPEGVAVDARGNLYIADTGNNCIRMVSDGVIVTLAGNGTAGFSGDNGPATGAALNYPNSVAVDADGSLYITDSDNDCVRKVSNGVIATVAGNGLDGFSGDNGPATSAAMSAPSGVATDAAHNLYVGDAFNNRIRVLIPSGAFCSASVAPLALFPASSGGTFTFTIQTSLSCPWAVQSEPEWITVSGSAAGTGSGSVMLSVAANPGPPRTGIVSIAGASVMVSEASAPALGVAKTHAGNFVQGQAGATYTVTVSNGVSADATSGVVTVTEAPPTGLVLASMAGTGWSCPGGGSACTRSDPLAGGSSYPPITVTVNVASNAPSQPTNQVTVSGGGSPSAAASDVTIVNPPHPPFFTGEVPLSAGVYYLRFPDGNLFGYYSYLSGGWIYHFDMGYEYVVTAGNSVYLWDLGAGHWLYTSASVFPYLYDFTLKAWLYYIPDTTNPGHYTSNPRYFTNLSTGQVFAM